MATIEISMTAKITGAPEEAPADDSLLVVFSIGEPKDGAEDVFDVGVFRPAYEGPFIKRS